MGFTSRGITRVAVRPRFQKSPRQGSRAAGGAGLRSAPSPPVTLPSCKAHGQQLVLQGKDELLNKRCWDLGEKSTHLGK